MIGRHVAATLLAFATFAIPACALELNDTNVPAPCRQICLPVVLLSGACAGAERRVLGPLPVPVPVPSSPQPAAVESPSSTAIPSAAPAAPPPASTPIITPVNTPASTPVSIPASTPQPTTSTPPPLVATSPPLPPPAAAPPNPSTPPALPPISSPPAVSSPPPPDFLTPLPITTSPPASTTDTTTTSRERRRSSRTETSTLDRSSLIAAIESAARANLSGGRNRGGGDGGGNGESFDNGLGVTVTPLLPREMDVGEMGEADGELRKRQEDPSTAEHDQFERACYCRNLSFDVAGISGLCQSCISQNMNDANAGLPQINRILSQCGFPAASFAPESARQAAGITLVALMPTRLPQVAGSNGLIFAPGVMPTGGVEAAPVANSTSNVGNASQAPVSTSTGPVSTSTGAGNGKELEGRVLSSPAMFGLWVCIVFLIVL